MFKIVALALLVCVAARQSKEFVKHHEALHMRDMNARHLAIMAEVNSNPAST